MIIAADVASLRRQVINCSENLVLKPLCMILFDVEASWCLLLSNRGDDKALDTWLRLSEIFYFIEDLVAV